MSLFSLRRAAHTTLVLATLTAAGWSADEPPALLEPLDSVSELKEITGAVSCFDGYITRVIVTRAGAIISMANGLGQSCYDGWLQQADSISGPPRKLLMLGPNTLMAKDEGIMGSSPRLVAMIAPGLFVFNLNCSRSFPDSTHPGEGATGNIVIYDQVNNSLTNLTHLSRRSGRFVEAIAWIADEEVILIEESHIGSSNEPSPMRGTGKRAVVTLDGVRHDEFTKFPIAASVYSSLRSLELRKEQAGDDADFTRWALTRMSDEAVIYFDVADGGQSPQARPRVFPLDLAPSEVVVSHASFGTWIADLDGSFRRRVSSHHAIGIDRDTDTLLLRSSALDENGFYRYWLLDIQRLAS